MEHNDIKTKVYELASQIAEDEELELVDIEILGRGRKLVRVTVDKEGGVTVGDCERMSRSLEALLDVEDPIKASYTLEVTSPGLDRPLKRQNDFERHIGKLARVVTTEPIAGQTFFVGRIIDVGDGWIRLRMEPLGAPKPGGRKEPAAAPENDTFIPLDKLSRARLEIEMKQKHPERNI